MNYTVIDPIIVQWAKHNSLTLGTNYKDYEVRSIDIVSRAGNRCQIWIDIPIDGTVKVHVWNYKKKRIDWDIPVNDLRTCLDQALIVANEWLSEKHITS